MFRSKLTGSIAPSFVWLVGLLTALQGSPQAALPVQSDAGEREFSAAGQGLVRIESERKLSVPDELVEPVWKWLGERYHDLGWLDDSEHTFSASLGHEDFIDTYFDDSELSVLAEHGGVRHRRRVVHSGPAFAKDGRELLQIKLARGDATGVARSEIKFEVDRPNRIKDRGDAHPMLGLVSRSLRPQVIEQLHALGFDPWALRPVLTVQQHRRRVYLSDRGGAFATLTLDECTCNDNGAELDWTEIELELNEIRYTSAAPAERVAFEAVVERIEADLLSQFPSITRDQTPKYTKAFRGIEEATLVPLGTLHRWGLRIGDLWAMGFVAVLAVVAGVLYRHVQHRARVRLNRDAAFPGTLAGLDPRH
jgi:hypothetical protein